MTSLQPDDQHLPDEARDLVRALGSVTMPLTGEVIDLANPHDVAQGVEAIDELNAKLTDLRQLFTMLLRAESKRQGSKTLHLDDLQVTLSPGYRNEYDGNELSTRLLAAGLPVERLEAMVQPILTWKVDGRKIRQLEAANPEYAAIIADCRTSAPVNVRASVTRKRRR
jgi:hypothetical protein